jgi:hypothetical protein
MRALILVDAALSAAGIEGGPVLFVHDEIVVEVPESDAERTRTIVVGAMTQAFGATLPNAPLNGLVETKVSTAWGPREEHHTTDGSARDADGSALPPEGGTSAVARRRLGLDSAVTADGSATIRAI